MGEIKLGPLNSEITLPVLNWPSGSSPEMPVGTTNYVDKVALADGSVRYNFRTSAPRNWTLTWERLTAAEAATITSFESYNDVLRFQNTWLEPNWHWVIITDITCTPIATTFVGGTPFFRISLSLEEILQGQAVAPIPPSSTDTVLPTPVASAMSLAATSPVLRGAAPGDIYAASPALADVQAAIASASDGDTVIIPAGSATWTSNLVITKYIVLKGSGYANTIITSGYTGTGNQFDTSYYLVSFNPSFSALGQPFRLSAFTIDGNNHCMPLFLKNNNVNFVNRVRIDHMRTYGRNQNASLWIKGHVWGVADHNILDGGYISVDFYDQVTWSNYNYDFGTANAFYFEDNNIVGGAAANGGNVIRSEEGAMWVARYNTFDCSTMTNGLYPWFDGHGNGTGHWSVMGVEIYENAVVDGKQGVSIGQRGGKFLVFNNTCNVYLQEQIWEEFNDDYYGPPIASPNGQPQHCSDSYYWNNRGSNGRKDVIYTDYQIDYGGDVGVVPRPDHTFWQENAAAFDGSSGVGFGLRSARPGSCTLEGAAYWATDERKLYRWHSGAWQLYYTPYTYPHPLISDPIIGD